MGPQSSTRGGCRCRPALVTALQFSSAGLFTIHFLKPGLPQRWSHQSHRQGAFSEHHLGCNPREVLALQITRGNCQRVKKDLQIFYQYKQNLTNKDLNTGLNRIPYCFYTQNSSIQMIDSIKTDHLTLKDI